MWAISKIEDLNSDQVAHFPGFVSTLLYTTAHKDFRSSITENWDAFHEFSGKNLLILVADAPDAPAPSAKRAPDGVTHMMVSLGSFDGSNTNKLNARATEVYGVKKTNLPCLVFFDSVDGVPTTLTYKFNRSNRILDDLMAVFEACDKAWISSPDADPLSLAQHRRHLLEVNLKPRLNTMGFLRSVSNIAQHPAFASLLGGLSSR